MNQLMGRKVRDRITGFEGVVTGYVTKTGARRDAEWFDEQRPEVDRKAKPVVLVNDPAPGFDKEAPKR
jgi:hypothetical protein